jgi:general secretion pathway protein M
MNKLKEKWEDLSPRERIYLTLTGVFLILIFGYYGIIAPLLNSVADLQQKMTAQENLAAWMEPRVAVLKTYSNQESVTSISPANLLTTVDTQLKQSEFARAVTEISQANATQVRVTLKDVPFDTLMAWLVQIWQKNQIQVVDFDAQKTDKPGIVTATMVLGVNS